MLDRRPSAKPPDDFAPFMMRDDDRLVSYFVDLALKAVAPDPALPLNLTATLRLNEPNDAGFPTDEEAKQLWSLEERLLEALTTIKAIRYLGRTSTDGKRTFFFQAASTDGFKAAARSVETGPPVYPFELRWREDPAWEIYLEDLYPPPVEHQRVQNLHVRLALHEQGDAHDLSREVEHFLHFRTEADRDAAAADAQRIGFTTERPPVFTEEEMEDLGEDSRRLPWTLVCKRTQPVDRASIDAATDPLVPLASAHGGIYDGWGCMVTKPHLLRRVLDRLCGNSAESRNAASGP